MKGKFPIEKFQQTQTPFYYYDTSLLRQTLRTINEEAGRREGFCVHYAVKANANPKVLNVICQAGLGADCVSGGEIRASIDAGFPASKIVYAGVERATGKSIWDSTTTSLHSMWRACPNLRLSTNWQKQKER